MLCFIFFPMEMSQCYSKQPKEMDDSSYQVVRPYVSSLCRSLLISKEKPMATFSPYINILLNDFVLCPLGDQITFQSGWDYCQCCVGLIEGIRYKKHIVEWWNFLWGLKWQKDHCYRMLDEVVDKRSNSFQGLLLRNHPSLSHDVILRKSRATYNALIPKTFMNVVMAT